jgi:hypothetical protein
LSRSAGTSTARRSTSPFEGVQEGYTSDARMTDAHDDGGAIQEPQADSDGNNRAGFYDETRMNEPEARDHESGQNSDDNLSSPSHSRVYSPEVSICNIYFSLND